MSIAKIKKILIYFFFSLLIILLTNFIFEKIISTIQPATAKIEIESPVSGDRLNVKDFGAKGDGRNDDTLAIQKAIDAAIRNFQDSNTRDFRTVYFPQGTYLVSDTIQLGRFKIIQGSGENLTIIRLKDSSPGYSDTPKPVLRSMYNNNQTFGIYIRDLTIDTGKRNSKAIAIRYNTHNVGTIENVTIKSEDLAGAVGLDLSETEFGPGMVKNLTVKGFDIGIKTPGAPSNAVFHHVTLKQQNVVGFENNMPVSIEGLKSENKVPAIRNSSHPLAHLILINANLIGFSAGPSQNLAAIETEGPYYLRQIKIEGSYTAALKDRGKLLSQKQIDEKWSDLSTVIPPSKKGHLKLTIKEPPLPYLEPEDNWIIPDDSGDNDTAAIQAAMNSGAKTIFFPGNFKYKINDTIEVPSSVRRIVAQHSGIKGTETFKSKPMLRFVGNTSEPISIEGLSIGAWPHSIIAFEVASDRQVYFKYSNNFAARNTITTSPNWSGEIYIDEYLGSLKLNGTGSTWIRQWNPENNPFKPGKSNPELTYAVNNGAKLWVLGTKTEAPAINVLTQKDGKTEILGGFFRDHFAPEEYQPTVPYFITKNASLSASYLQYAWGPGKARRLQAIETQDKQKNELVTPPELLTVELYHSSFNAIKR